MSNPNSSTQPPTSAEDQIESSQPPSLIDQVKTVKLTDLSTITTVPCARTGLLYGVGTGIVLGSLHFLISLRTSKLPFKTFLTPSTVLSSCHRAMAGFGFVSIVAWEKCRYDRKIAAQKVNLVAEQFRRAEKKRNTKVHEQTQKQDIQKEDNPTE